MRLAAYGILASALAMSTADMTPSPQMIQNSALAILGWVVWYLLARAFPALIQAQKDSQKEEREAYLTAQKEERTAFLEAQEASRREFRESLSEMAAAISGLRNAEG